MVFFEFLMRELFFVFCLSYVSAQTPVAYGLVIVVSREDASVNEDIEEDRRRNLDDGEKEKPEFAEKKDVCQG